MSEDIERTYTQAEVEQLLEEERQAQARNAQRAIAFAEAQAERLVEEAREAAGQSIREVKAQAQAYIADVMEKRAASYQMGIADGDRCGAQAGSWRQDDSGEDVFVPLLLGGRPVYCQREPGHALGPYDRHKAVFGAPHLAVVWNED